MPTVMISALFIVSRSCLDFQTQEDHSGNINTKLFRPPRGESNGENVLFRDPDSSLVYVKLKK